MRIVLIQFALNLQELNQLHREFPQFLFLSFPQYTTPISKDHWAKAEILFGSRLAEQELQYSEKLRWIHTPTAQLNRLCIKEIEAKGNILVTQTRDENLFQIGEYVLAAVLAFAKNLFPFKELTHAPQNLWDSKWRHTMWTLKNRIFLQIGMSKVGVEIARRASEAGMQVWSMGETASFHPHCHKNLSIKDLASTLPEADVVSLSLPPEKQFEKLLGEAELNLMKDGSILCILGTRKCFDEQALIALGSKLRGILLDADYSFPISSHSKLWQLPNILITPEIAPRPKSLGREAFKTFRYNLRQYVHGNFSEMRNLIDPSILLDLVEG